MSTSPGSNTSLFSNTHGVNTHGGEHYAAGRDVIHNHFYNHPGHASGPPHENNVNAIPDRPDTSTSSSGPLFRFPDVSRFFRFRTLDVEIISIVEAEFSSLLNRSSAAASTIPRVSEMYLRLMLDHRHGYPLYHPEPRRGLPIEYRRKGIRIGDVGRITPDGAFDFLFNVDSSLASTVNPSVLPRGFETIQPIEFLSEDYFQSDEHLLSNHVHQVEDTPITYKFSAPEGSVLQLPEGATLFEARNMNDLYQLAIRHARSWYEYMATYRSIDIPNGSLYIVTGCIKTRDWGIGTLYGHPSERDYLTFTSKDQPPRRKYGWRKSGPVTTKVGPTATDIIVTSDEEPNQCVFIRGYKVALGEKLWKKVRTSVSVPSKKGGPFTTSSSSIPGRPGGFGNQGNTLSRNSAPSGSALGHATHNEKGSTASQGELHQSLDDLSISDVSDEESESIVAKPIVHPSDIIISTLAHLEPEAEVILVHDNEWCSLLPNDFALDPWNLDIKGLLERIAESFMAAVDPSECASLVRRTTTTFSEGAPYDTQDCKDEVSSPTLHNSLSAITTASSKRFPPEIIEEILDHLDFLSKMRCRAVCSTFRELIDSSPYFQWQRELTISGMEDGGNYPLAIRRQMLEQHQKNWSKMSWTREERRKWMGGLSRINANVLAQSDPGRTVIYVDQLASSTRNTEARSWTVDIRTMQLDHFEIDASQNLLVIFGKPFERQSQHVCPIFVRKLSTGEPHPLATGTHLLTHASTHRHEIQKWGHVISGENLCAIFGDGTEIETEIKVWNWKSGQVIANLMGDHLGGASFLSERHIMLVTEQEPRLVVIDLTAQSNEKQRVSDLTNAYTFGFPPLAETAELYSMDILSKPNPDWTPNPALYAPFFTARNDRLRVINLVIDDGNGNDPEVVIFARDSTFLSLIESATRLNSSHFDWPMWGPDGTRMMVSTSTHILYSAYGMKFISTLQLKGQTANYLYVYDFNQPALHWGKRNENGLEEMTHDNEVDSSTQEGKAEDSPSYTNITEPTKIAAGNIFQDEVETRLGYRACRWTIPGRPRVQFPQFCGEDGIVLRYGQSDTEEFHFLTL